MHDYLKLFAVCLLLVLTTACGFQLRGNAKLPQGIEPFYISTPNTTGNLYIELRNIFQANDIDLSPNPGEANYQLQIIKQDKQRRGTTVGNDGHTAQYQLLEIVTFQLTNKQGAVVFGPQSMTERRTLQNDPNRVISTNVEEKLLREEMKKSLARKIVRQISNIDFHSLEAKNTVIDPDAS